MNANIKAYITNKKTKKRGCIDKYFYVFIIQKKMAKGYDEHIERKNKVNSFGRELTRRAKSKCELCEATGVSLSVYEVPPVKGDPEIERCIFICDECRDKIDRIKKAKENDFRFLTNSI